MSTGAEPEVIPTWGELATDPGDMVQPSNTQIQDGWQESATPPPRQYFNWFQNYVANALCYFLQRGLVDYNAAQTYQLNARVIGDDGNSYVSLQNANQGNTPSTSGSWWARWGFTASQLSGLYAPINSPNFTGYATVPTQAQTDNSTTIQNSAWLKTGLLFSLGGAGGQFYLALPKWLTGGTTRLVIKWGTSQSAGSLTYDTTIPFAGTPALVLGDVNGSTDILTQSSTGATFGGGTACNYIAIGID